MDKATKSRGDSSKWYPATMRFPRSHELGNLYLELVTYLISVHFQRCTSYLCSCFWIIMHLECITLVALLIEFSFLIGHI